MGNLAVPGGERNSPIVCALEVVEADEVMIVTAGGQVTRAAADSVPVQGRRTQGRRMVPIEVGDRVVEVTRAQGRGGAPARDDVSSGADDTPSGSDDDFGDGQLDLLGE
jgi:DNA gyrase subunit A